RDPRRVAEVEDRLPREAPPQLAYDGQPADPGVEDADRALGIRGHGEPPVRSWRPTDTPPPDGRGSAVIPAGKSERCALTKASTPAASIQKIVQAIQSSRCCLRASIRPRIPWIRGSSSVILS